MRLAAQAKGGLLSHPTARARSARHPAAPPGPPARPGITAPSAYSIPAAAPGPPWPTSPAACTRTAPCPWRPTAWSCTRSGPPQATGRLDHTLATDLFAAAIANRAFGLLLLESTV